MKLRRVPGCPLVFVSRTVLVMEQPSGKTKADFEKSEVKELVGYLVVRLVLFVGLWDGSWFAD